MQNAFIVLETNNFGAGEERLSAGDERVKNTRSNLTHTHTGSYQQLSNKTYLEMIATHRYSPSKTGDSYHTLILASKYTLHPQVVYTKAFSARLIRRQVE